MVNVGCFAEQRHEVQVLAGHAAGGRGESMAGNVQWLAICRNACVGLQGSEGVMTSKGDSTAEHSGQWVQESAGSVTLVGAFADRGSQSAGRLVHAAERGTVWLWLPQWSPHSQFDVGLHGSSRRALQFLASSARVLALF